MQKKSRLCFNYVMSQVRVELVQYFEISDNLPCFCRTEQSKVLKEKFENRIIELL